MKLKHLKSQAKSMSRSVKAGVKPKNKKELEGYYFDGKKLHVLYKTKR